MGLTAFRLPTKRLPAIYMAYHHCMTTINPECPAPPERPVAADLLLRQEPDEEEDEDEEEDDKTNEDDDEEGDETDDGYSE